MSMIRGRVQPDREIYTTCIRAGDLPFPFKLGEDGVWRDKDGNAAKVVSLLEYLKMDEPKKSKSDPR